MGSEGERHSVRATPLRITPPRHLVLVGANHRTCPIDERERLLRRVTYSRLWKTTGASRRWEDLVLLTTCNRIEAYAVTSEPDEAIAALHEVFELPADSEDMYVLAGTDAAAHLLRVAAGLDSLAQGEGQVTGQVRRAPASRPRSHRKPTALSEAFERAARDAPRIRSLAGLAAVNTSASHAALRFLEASVPLAHPTIGLLGTGKMARIAAASLKGRSQIIVVNRDRRRAREVARELGGRGVGLEELDGILETADVILTATAARRPLLSERRLRRAVARRGGRHLWLVDLGFPRNVDPACHHLPGVTLIDLDGLAPWGVRPLPPAALARAESRIREEAAQVVASLNPSEWGDVADLRRTAEAVRRREVEEALGRLPTLTVEDRAVVDKLAARLVNRFLHGPTERLRSLPEDERTEIVRDLLRGLGGVGR